ncbi:MAG: oxaloacetate decarboxylase [Anaerolineales bacterium]
MKKSTILRKAIMDRRALVVPGCHDALSAKIIERAGFEAVQVSGFGIAAAFLCKPDVGLMQMKDILDITANIVLSVNIPVMADLDTGGGNAINTAENVQKLIQMGAAGVNIEDQVFPKRCGHLPGKEVIPVEEMEGKIRAAVDVRNTLDPDFIINARTDAYAVDGFEAALERCIRYFEAGADLVFIDGIHTRAEIEIAIRKLPCPLSVNLMDGITGVKTELIPIPELAMMGVGRVSIPIASILVAHRALSNFFSALKTSPTGILAGQLHWIASFNEFTDFVGLIEYQQMEDEYLPRFMVESKYRNSAHN